MTDASTRVLGKIQRDWSDLGRLDPYWAMTGAHGDSDATSNPSSLAADGDAWITPILAAAARLGRPVHHTRALDYGCGTGRLARALAGRFETYVGIDISEPLVAVARQIHRDAENCTFLTRCTDRLSELPDSQFDLVLCWAVLQHISSRRVVAQYVADFLRVVRPDGVVIFQTFGSIDLPYRLQPRRRAYAILRRLGVSAEVLYSRLGLYPQEAHFFPDRAMRHLLDRLGARILHIDDERDDGSPHHSLTYYVAKG